MARALATGVGAYESGSALPATLTVLRAGSGSGTVTSSPRGIDCHSACSASFGEGTVVTLTATPAAGSTFTGWSGAGCSGTGALPGGDERGRNHDRNVRLRGNRHAGRVKVRQRLGIGHEQPSGHQLRFGLLRGRLARARS